MLYSIKKFYYQLLLLFFNKEFNVWLNCNYCINEQYSSNTLPVNIWRKTGTSNLFNINEIKNSYISYLLELKK